MKFGGDLAGFDFASSAPEDIGVGNGHADICQVSIDGGFVGEDAIFFGAMTDRHNIDLIEFWASFAPVAVG